MADLALDHILLGRLQHLGFVQSHINASPETRNYLASDYSMLTADSTERQPVIWSRTQTLDGVQVVGCAITLIFLQIVTRVFQVQRGDESVAFNLGQDRCSSDGERKSIAFHDIVLRNVQAVDNNPVAKKVIRSLPQAVYGSSHCLPCSFQNIDLVNY